MSLGKATVREIARLARIDVPDQGISPLPSGLRPSWAGAAAGPWPVVNWETTGSELIDYEWEVSPHPKHGNVKAPANKPPGGFPGMFSSPNPTKIPKNAWESRGTETQSLSKGTRSKEEVALAWEYTGPRGVQNNHESPYRALGLVSNANGKPSQPVLGSPEAARSAPMRRRHSRTPLLANAGQRPVHEETPPSADPQGPEVKGSSPPVVTAPVSGSRGFRATSAPEPQTTFKRPKNLPPGAMSTMVGKPISGPEVTEPHSPHKGLMVPQLESSKGSTNKRRGWRDEAEVPPQPLTKQDKIRQKWGLAETRVHCTVTTALRL